MGIKSLKSLVPGVEKKLSDYRGKRIGVDISIWLYQFIYRDEDNAVISGVLKQLRQFHHHGIIPVYVFDGSNVNPEVKLVLEERQARRQKVHDSIDTLTTELAETLETLGETAAASAVLLEPVVSGNVLPHFIAIEGEDGDYSPIMVDNQKRALELQTRITSLEKQTRRPSREAVQDCKDLFSILGIEYVQSEGESDITLSDMMKAGVIDAVMSEDTDMLPYGCHTFLAGFHSNRDTVVEYKLATILETLALTYEQFIDVCILCGCDYAEKIYKVGVKKGYEFIKRYGSIETLLEHISSVPALKERHPYSDGFMDGVRVARGMFLNPRATFVPAREYKAWGGGVSRQIFGEYLNRHGIIDHSSYIGMCTNNQPTMKAFFTPQAKANPQSSLEGSGLGQNMVISRSRPPVKDNNACLFADD